MEELKSLIQKVDDDYLIGLSNKGTVKRAYKDLETQKPEGIWQGSEAQVTLKEETCVIRAPLGESSCSCPSRNICRHVMTAILWLKNSMAGEERAQTAGPEPQIETETQGSTKEPEPQIETELQGSMKEPEPPKVLGEVLQLPAEKLKRACGSSRYRQLLTRIRNGELSAAEESSIVAISLPWENVTVKLLEPFTYSTCSCHSKELCTHKAQAALIYQFQKEKITLKELEALQEAETSLDKGQVRSACKKVQEVICHQISTGMSRHFQEAPDELERLAVLAHRAALPQLESWLREAASLYEKYGSRSAAFRTEDLLHRLLRLYIRAGRLLEAKKQEEIRALSGIFRDTYELAGNLQLMGIGSREFHSKTGYEGEIYYFLEKEQGTWYTWTDARPVYYEKTRRRPVSSMGNGSAPWGLPCSREEMLNLEFVLENAKAASGGRLSISQETKGEIIGNRDLASEIFEKKIIWDYEKLIGQYFTSRQEQEGEGRKERLALVGAVRTGTSAFDKINQRFSWSLYDQAGRKLFISLRYTKEEKTVIRLLERLEQRLKSQEQKQILFFGFLYLDEEGRVCLYPIEFFQTKVDVAEKSDVPEQEKKKLPRLEVLNTLEQYQKEAVGQLTDLFVSGLYSVQDTSVERILELADEGERLGLHKAGKDLEEISRLLKEKRHRMEFKPGPVVAAMANIYRYLDVCREKVSTDKALLTIRSGQ